MCSNLKKINLKASNSLKATGHYVVPILFDAPRLTTEMTNLWFLGKLRILSLPFEGGLFEDETLRKVSICFPNLHTLYFGDSRLSSDGVAHLCRLKNLRCLTMAQVTGQIDEGILKLAQEVRLKKLNLALTHVEFSTILDIVQYSPSLEVLNISRSVSNYQVHHGTMITIQQTVQLIELRTQIGNCGQVKNSLTIVHNDPAVWTSGIVRTTLENLSFQESSLIKVIALADYCKIERDDEDIGEIL